MQNRNLMAKIIERFETHFRLQRWWEAVDYDLYHIMIAIILSQRCYYKNVIKAMEGFTRRYPTPLDAACDPEGVRKAIRPTGLVDMRAPTVLAFSETLAERFDNNVDGFLRLPPEKARRLLIAHKGIGDKTADVIMMALFQEQVFPVDAHIARILRRLGIIDPDDNYIEMKTKAEMLIPSEKRAYMHMAFISFGRQICRPRAPKCKECFLAELCTKIGVD